MADEPLPPAPEETEAPSPLAHGQTPLRPGWHRAPPEHLPRPTYWPVVMALGIAFTGWGLISTPLLSVVGLLLFGLALAGWIGEMWDEHRAD
jgi:hypothetical protein